MLSRQFGGGGKWLFWLWMCNLEHWPGKYLSCEQQISYLEAQSKLINSNQKSIYELDQVYCAWLIKWVLKREIIQLAELCLSRWWIKSGTWWYWISIWRYSLVLGQYKLELLGFRWYRVSKGLECLYILEKVEIWSGDTDASLTDWLTDRHQNIGLLSLSPV